VPNGPEKLSSMKDPVEPMCESDKFELRDAREEIEDAWLRLCVMGIEVMFEGMYWLKATIVNFDFQKRSRRTHKSGLAECSRTHRAGQSRVQRHRWTMGLRNLGVLGIQIQPVQCR
jgi:hypothetical protein